MAYYDIYIGNKPYTLYIEESPYDAFLYADVDKVKELAYNAYAQLNIKYNQATENLEVNIVAFSPQGKYLIDDDSVKVPTLLIPETNNAHRYGCYTSGRMKYKRLERFDKRGGYYKGTDPINPIYDWQYYTSFIVNKDSHNKTFIYPIEQFIDSDGGTIGNSLVGVNHWVGQAFQPSQAYYKIKFNLWGHGRYKKTLSNKVTIYGKDVSYLKDQI